MNIVKYSKTIASIAAICGVLWGGYYTLDSTYARAADVQQKVGDIKTLYLQSERRALQREFFQLQVKFEETGVLTRLEKQRMQVIKQQMKEIDQEIHDIRKQSIQQK